MYRCIAVIGASGSGKSTLVDQLCSLEGSKPPAPAPLESRLAEFDFIGDRWGVIDCPGSSEFLQDTYDALLVADAAVICISPDPEQAVLSAPFIRAAEEANTPTILFINKIDEARGRIRDIASSLQDYSTQPIVLRQIPIRQDDDIVGAVDLVSERAWKYQDGAPSALVEIPGDLEDREHEAREALLEHLSEFDDWLLEEIIEDRVPADGPLYSICSRILAEHGAVPGFIGSALHMNGIMRLMKALRHEAPDVGQLRNRLAAGSDAQPEAVSFRVRHRKHVGKTIYLRSLIDGIKAGSNLDGHPVGFVSDPTSEKATAIETVAAGGLMAAVKSDHLTGGKIYTASASHSPPDWWSALSPQIGRAFEATNDRDDVKLSEALSKITEDHPAVTVSHDPETGSNVVWGQGGLHLRTIRNLLLEDYGVETTDHPVSGAYRESITQSYDVHYRHKKQSGGAGQFADVRLTVSPNKRGAGFAFEEVVKGGVIPRNYMPAVSHGAEEAMASGPLGFPVVDVHVRVTDGQHHSVDSSDMAFRIAARSGVHEGLNNASPVLLEPFYAVEFRIPSVFTGALVPVVSTNRGQVLGFDRDTTANGWDSFRALMPGGALVDLIRELHSISQGVGRFESTFDHYVELYGKDAEKIVQEKKAS